MVNFGWNSASILGIFLAVAGAGLYFLRSVRPEVSRDYDIFFSAVGLACGIILLFNGWRLDPILQFSQFLLAASTAFFAFETVRLRGLATEQAKRSTPIVDDDRPVSRSYKAYREPDYEEIEPEWEERVKQRRLRASPERRSDYEEESRRSRGRGRDDREPPSSRRRSSRPSSPPPPERSDRPSPRLSKNDPYTSAGRYSDRYDEWEDDWEEPENGNDRPSDYDDRPTRERPSRRPSTRDRDAEPPTRSPKESPRSSSPSRRSSPRPYEDEEPAPYVDYVDYSEANDESDDDFEDFDRSDEERDDFEDFDRSEERDRDNDRYDEDDEDWKDVRNKSDRFDY